MVIPVPTPNSQGQRRVRRWPWLFGSLVLATGLLAIRTPYRTNEPCPGGGRQIAATAVRLVPSVLRHRSWVEVPSNAISAGDKLLACIDGRLVGENIVDEDDLVGPFTQIGIPTNWVAMQWLAGRLDTYRSVDRWTVMVVPHLPSAPPFGAHPLRR